VHIRPTEKVIYQKYFYLLPLSPYFGCWRYTVTVESRRSGLKQKLHRRLLCADLLQGVVGRSHVGVLRPVDSHQEPSGGTVALESARRGHVAQERGHGRQVGLDRVGREPSPLQDPHDAIGVRQPPRGQNIVVLPGNIVHPESLGQLLQAARVHPGRVRSTSLKGFPEHIRASFVPAAVHRRRRDFYFEGLTNAGSKGVPMGGESEYPRSAFKYQNKNLMVVV